MISSVRGSLRLVMWTMCGTCNMIFKRDAATEFLKMYFQCCENHKPNSNNFDCTAEKAEISDRSQNLEKQNKTYLMSRAHKTCVAFVQFLLTTSLLLFHMTLFASVLFEI